MMQGTGIRERETYTARKAVLRRLLDVPRPLSLNAGTVHDASARLSFPFPGGSHHEGRP
jgi:hypothetical protein